MPRVSYERAYKLFPACAIGATDQPKTVADLVFAAKHEIDMYEEHQDGCLSANEIEQCRKFVRTIGDLNG